MTEPHKRLYDTLTIRWPMASKTSLSTSKRYTIAEALPHINERDTARRIDAKKKPWNRKCIIGLLLMVHIAGCASQSPPPVYIVDDPRMISSIDSITMLPIVSVAKIKEDEAAELLQLVYKLLVTELAFKGYVLSKSEIFSDRQTYTPQQVSTMGTQQLAQLGPADSHHILLCYIQQLDKSNVVLAQSASVELSAVLIDRKQSKVLWQNEAKSSVTTSIIHPQGLVTGLAMMVGIKEDIFAFANAFRSLFKSFPDKNNS